MSDDNTRKTLNEYDLLAVVAHDLKTPITSVRGYIELVGKFGELNERQQQFCERALIGLDRMERFITSVLEFAHLEGDVQMNFVECDLRPIVESAVDLMEQMAIRREITLHVDMTSTLEPINGDPQWLGEVFTNLLSNAIKYNRQGGEVWLRVSDQPGYILVSIHDTGVGISPEDQGRIFQRFFRSRATKAAAEGTGLGLAIAQVIVEKHRGQIWVESVPGEGSTFHFTLPRLPGAGEMTAEATAVESQDRAHSPHVDAGIELPDPVDDNLQEAGGLFDSDSTSELV